MSENFKALVINQSENNFTREIKTLEKKFLKHGDVLVKVDYSGLNYKDALILKNGGKLVKEFPHIPGIDFSGTVVESKNNSFKTGDEVIVITGKDTGKTGTLSKFISKSKLSLFTLDIKTLFLAKYVYSTNNKTLSMI